MADAVKELPVIAPFPRRAAALWAIVLLLCTIALGVTLRRTVVLIAPSSVERAGQFGDLDRAFATRRALTLTHIVPAAVFVLLIPIWLMKRNWERPELHRKLTYGLLGLGTLVGITAMMLSRHPVGGLNESTAAIFYDCLFLFSVLRSGITLRQGRVELSRTWMMRAFAVLLGIATTRPVMGVFFATQAITHLQPQQFFGTAFWIGFSLTYVAGEAYLRTRSQTGGSGGGEDRRAAGLAVT
jgi:Predicted membrane protein (DUF2306)